MLELLLKRATVVVLGTFVSQILSTQDVNLSMYMYLANHLTPQECSRLAAHLYAGGLELTAVKELEQELPTDQPCLSLLTTWNNTDGREKSFLTVANCLRKIGQDQLAEWLSDTVFTQLTMELNDCFLQNTSSRNIVTDRPSRPLKIRLKSKIENCSSEKTFLFLLFDTLCMYIILMTITTLVFYSLGSLVCLVKESQKILMEQKRKYAILENGILPQDLDSEDEVLDPFF